MAARIRAWQWVQPANEREQPGLRLTSQGKIAMVEDAEAVGQSIRMLLSTMPGERVMLPEYGCDLYRLAFEPNDQTTAGLAIHYVRQALERWEPRAEILHLDAGPDPEFPERLQIELRYRLRTSMQEGQVIYSFNLAG